MQNLNPLSKNFHPSHVPRKVGSRFEHFSRSGGDSASTRVAESFYIFGGDSGHSSYTATNTIAAFSTVTKKWKKVGELNQARLANGVFIQQEDFVVVGGSELFDTERCTLNGDVIRCTVVNPRLYEYGFYPEMMAIEPDYCPK